MPAPLTKRPLRVMQLHTLYNKYHDVFYDQCPHLKKDSFSNQMLAVVRDAYSAIHMLTPYMVGCKTMLVMGNCLEMQRAWLHEQGGTWEKNSDWQNDIVRQQIAYFRPDILYITASGQYSSDFIASLPTRPPLVIGWRASDVQFGTDWSGFDVMLSGLPRLLTLAESLGAGKGIMFHPGMPSWIAREVEHIPQSVDIVFVGSVFPRQHVQRLALLERIAVAATQHGFSLALYLNCPPHLLSPLLRPYIHPPVFGMEMHRALRQGRIVLDDRASHGLVMPDGRKSIDLGGEDTINMRMFEATGGGSLLLTEALPGVARYFTPEKEVAVYTDHEHAVHQIMHYLAHPDDREAVAAKGKARCLTEHNINSRAKAFLEMATALLP